MKKSLQDIIDEAGSATNLLRADKSDRVDIIDTYNPGLIMPQLPMEFSSWERESRAWHEGVALFDQTHHMEGVFVEGPDARAFLGFLSCNSLFKSKPNKASQIICVNDDGLMIGDGIVFHLEDNKFSIYGAPMIPTWVTYHAEKLDFDVVVTQDRRSPVYANGTGNVRPNCRYQLQGPLAGKLIEKLNNGPIGDVKFFGMTEIVIAGHRCGALRHGMAGALGLEIWGDWQHRQEIRDEIINAGQEFGITLVGSMAYLVPAIESGWYQAILPAIFSGDALKSFRQWVSKEDHNALMRLQGSKTYDEIDGFYRTPYDLDLGKFINFKHDFIGKSALGLMESRNATKKVTLAWNPDDVANLFREMVTPGGKDIRFLHLPVSCDKIGIHYDTLTLGGTDAGVSAYTAYSTKERSVLSMALVNRDVVIGDEVEIHWGEAGGGYGTHITAATEIVKIRAVVSPAPYSRVAREDYRK